MDTINKKQKENEYQKEYRKNNLQRVKNWEKTSYNNYKKTPKGMYKIYKSKLKSANDTRKKLGLELEVVYTYQEIMMITNYNIRFFELQENEYFAVVRRDRKKGYDKNNLILQKRFI